MANEPLVSIIINNYNYDRFLAQAIDSGLNQTYPHIEVIVVDDGSTDNSRGVIAGYGDRITPIFQENGKQGAALNNGFAASHGDIILFLDSDDYLLPMTAERVVEAWKPEVAKIHYRLQVVDAESKPSGTFIPTTTMKLASGEVWRQLLQDGGYVSTPMSGNAYSRAALAQIVPIPDAYKTTADDYLMISIPFYGDLVGIEDSLGAYRIHDSNQWALTSVSGSRFRRFVQHDLQNFALLQQRAKEFGFEVPSDVEMRSLGRLWSRLASLRLEPQLHPVSSDRSPQLIYWGLRSLWQFSGFNWPKRVIYSIWFIWVGLMPRPLAKFGITWLYAPHLRPKVIDWALIRVRTLVS
ncbi:glycosyltransferase family 2 protein [Leptodesmis sichuanensis]|uniref:glycosyltransferase family 2 protein n=1 Tax=Leptodesmis sichuanensis TaxID=2906798 RepID=UPI001F2B56CC|nr:glycosyltransferase [Leptodesmis sichuanensis]UIE37507.1 glycosyltransferase family 2 protein [Leptodesmis sichuanensis A121]